MRSFPLLLFVIATPAAAQVRGVPVQPATGAEAATGVDVYLINEGAASVAAPAPERIETTASDGSHIVLEPAAPSVQTIAPGAFVRLRYRPLGPPAEALPASPVAAAVAEQGETIVPSATGSSGGLIDHLRLHEPIYGVWGPKSAGAKLQFSVAVQPFLGTGTLSHLRFGYTQTMFWDVNIDSGPFRGTIYSPEIWATVPAGRAMALDFGYRHDSNGGDAAHSVDSNRMFVRLRKSFDLGGGWYADLVPQAWFYVGKKGIATDLSRYWGYTSLKASVGERDGIKLTLTGRGNPGTGKGAAELFVSYPMTRLGGLGIYLFGQGFAGYGESLEEYDRTQTQARLGVAFTR